MEAEFSDEEDELCEDVLEETASAFSLLENEYKNIMLKLQDLEELSDVRDSYTKVYETFYQTLAHEQELLVRIDELEAKMDEHAAEIRAWKKQSKLDLQTMNDLQEQLNHARLLTDKAHEREQETQEVVENMRVQIMKLNTELELKSRLTSEDDDTGLSVTKEGFEREKQRLIDEITSLKQKLANAINYSEELERKNSAADIKTTEMNGVIEQNMTELTAKQRVIEKLEGTINTLKIDSEQQRIHIVEGEKNIEVCNKQISQLEGHLKEQKLLTEKSVKNADVIQLKLDKYEIECADLNNEVNDFKDKYNDTRKTLRLKVDDYNQLRSDYLKVEKQRDNCEKRLLLMDRLKGTMEVERGKLQTAAGILERELAVGKKQQADDKKTIDALMKAKEVLNKNIMRMQTVVDDHIKLIKIQAQSKRKLELDIQGLRNHISNQKKDIAKLEVERNRALEEALDLTQQVEDGMDDIKLKQQSIYEHKKIIAETETKLRQQQNLFEAVRADRNSFLKQLQNATSDVSELRAKLKICLHQTEQLKEEISAKEGLLIKQETVLRKLNKEKENLKVEVQGGLNTIQKLKHEIIEFQQSGKNLSQRIQENELMIRKQAKDLEQLINDRDVIGSQLVRRNDELGLLYEKINILEITLRSGEIQYDQRIEDIRLLKMEIKHIRQEKNYLSKSISNMTDLKHEVFTLERELAQERLKSTALEEELQHPMNIHRWRKLEGSNPEVLELLQKIQILQKRLLNQTSESIERERQLVESEKLYFNLRQVLARQPGPEVKNELIKTQRALTVRGNKMKCLVSELNMYEAQSTEYKMDADRLAKELHELKKKFYREKKINERIMNESKLPPINKSRASESESETKFTGGGYKMAP